MLRRNVINFNRTTASVLKRSKVTWKRLNSSDFGGTEPIGRCGTAGFYANNGIYMFGGDIASPPTGTPSDDFWRFDLEHNKWETVKHVSTEVPKARYGQAICKIDENNFLMHGGSVNSKTRLGDTWNYNLNDKMWKKIAEGPELDLHSLIKVDSSVLLFGGRMLEQQTTDRAKLFSFHVDNNVWFELENVKGDSFPIVHSGHGSVLMEEGQSMIVYGPGYTSLMVPEVANSHIWKFNILSSTWEQLPHKDGPPSPRAHHMVVAVDEERFWVIGGVTMKDQIPSWANADVWEYNLSTNTWKEHEIEGAPEGIVAAFPITANGNVYIVGGENNARKCTNDVWLLKEN